MRLYLAILVTNVNLCLAQAEHTLWLQEQVNGGVCWSGFGFGLWGGTNGTSQLYIEPGSTIKKAYLFYGLHDNYGGPSNEILLPFNMELNGLALSLDTTSPLFINQFYSSTEWLDYKFYSVDITNYISVGDIEVTYEIPEQPAGNNRFWFFSTYVIYENPILPLINTCIYLNKEKMWVPMSYDLNEHNKMDTSETISLSTIVTIAHFVEDGYNIYVDDDSIGRIGGNDNAADGPTGAITSGHFYHQNSTLFGLDDDTPDIWMDSSDVLANIRSHVTDPSELEILFDYSGEDDFPDGLTNAIWTMMINYSPACDATILAVGFDDTTICKGDTIQLQAIGGTRYKWEPSAFLDCDTCANPVCTTPQSRWYTCTMFTADSCSKTLPVFVRVNQPAKITGTGNEPDTCGSDVGIFGLYATGEEPLQYFMDGGLNPNENSFYNLSGGEHQLRITDANGCNFDTTVFVPWVNPVVAGFTSDKVVGHTPLYVYFTDESQNANEWKWLFNGDEDDEQNPWHVFTQPDTFTVTQIAYNKYDWCSDTAQMTIRAYGPVDVFIPNIFTPNNDGVNDILTINVFGCETVRWRIINRWGQEVVVGERKPEALEELIEIWDGINYGVPASDGTYFYKITVQSPAKITEEFVGSLQVAK